MSESTNCDKARLNDRTTETETLKTKIQDLSTTNNNIKSEKEKCKYELAKLDDQIIGLMTELSSVREYGREEELKLNQEVES